MHHNSDDRRDNVDRIQKNIDTTLHNIELADELIAKTSDAKTKRALKKKNARRKQALEGLRHEIRDEARDRDKD